MSLKLRSPRRILIAWADECRLWMIVVLAGLECDIAGKKKTFGPAINTLKPASGNSYRAYCEVREKTNKMQQLDVYYQHFLNMFRASLCPSSGEQDAC